MVAKKIEPLKTVKDPQVAKVAQRIDPDSPVQSQYTVEYAQRVRELQALQINDIEAFGVIASGLGIKGTKGQSLDDVLTDIVMAEFEKAGRQVYVEGGSPSEIAERLGSSNLSEEVDEEKFQDWGGRARTGKNGDKIRTNSAGQIINGR